MDWYKERKKEKKWKKKGEGNTLGTKDENEAEAKHVGPRQLALI